MVSLTENSILWYSINLCVKEIIFSCKNFPIVPLIGSRWCINYNHVMTLRQLGCPILMKLANEAVRTLILHDWGTKNPYMLQIIVRSWEKVNTKGRELGKRMLQPKNPILSGSERGSKRLSYLSLLTPCIIQMYLIQFIS